MCEVDDCEKCDKRNIWAYKQIELPVGDWEFEVFKSEGEGVEDD